MVPASLHIKWGRLSSQTLVHHAFALSSGNNRGTYTMSNHQTTYRQNLISFEYTPITPKSLILQTFGADSSTMRHVDAFALFS